MGSVESGVVYGTRERVILKESESVLPLGVLDWVGRREWIPRK